MKYTGKASQVGRWKVGGRYKKYKILRIRYNPVTLDYYLVIQKNGSKFRVYKNMRRKI